MSNDPNDLKPLTPNDLLLLGKNLTLPPTAFRKSDEYGRRWRHVQYIADCFWKRWVREYLPTLLLRQKWLKEKRNVEVGDLVHVVDGTIDRGRWKLGRVVEVNTGRDGFVRSAKVKTEKAVMVRPIAKLCLLEGID